MEGELMRIAMEPLLYEYGVDVVLGELRCSQTYFLFYGTYDLDDGYFHV